MQHPRLAAATGFAGLDMTGPAVSEAAALKTGWADAVHVDDRSITLTGTDPEVLSRELKADLATMSLGRADA